MFGNIYKNRRVLITGHTGFKGSWLALWLKKLGADVCGISLELDTSPAHSQLLNIDLRSEICDIRDLEKLSAIFHDFQPEIVFHLAAQPLVRRSYAEPVLTFQSNVMGTVNILETCRRTSSVKAVVAITSDKCYENRECSDGYKESDPMGGYDPYSASKGCSELVISSYRRSYFNPEMSGIDHQILLASARAGNVVGGGDWAADRLIPDIIRAAAGAPVLIRNPQAVRPWQHVFEPLSGYLLLGQKLFEGQREFASGWNFGPRENKAITVGEAAKMMQSGWDAIKLDINPPADQPHEAMLLSLNCEKAHKYLNWRGILTTNETFEMTSEWYKIFYTEKQVISSCQLDKYIETAKIREAVWTK